MHSMHYLIVEHLLINHLLDPMHCFKNVAVSIWPNIIGQNDNLNSREDLKEAKIMRGMWMGMDCFQMHLGY